jgi:hypothetical protein
VLCCSNRRWPLWRLVTSRSHARVRFASSILRYVRIIVFSLSLSLVRCLAVSEMLLQLSFHTSVCVRPNCDFGSRNLFVCAILELQWPMFQDLTAENTEITLFRDVTPWTLGNKCRPFECAIFYFGSMLLHSFASPKTRSFVRVAPAADGNAGTCLRVAAFLRGFGVPWRGSCASPAVFAAVVPIGRTSGGSAAVRRDATRRAEPSRMVVSSVPGRDRLVTGRDGETSCPALGSCLFTVVIYKRLVQWNCVCRRPMQSSEPRGTRCDHSNGLRMGNGNLLDVATVCTPSRRVILRRKRSYCNASNLRAYSREILLNRPVLYI